MKETMTYWYIPKVLQHDCPSCNYYITIFHIIILHFIIYAIILMYNICIFIGLAWHSIDDDCKSSSPKFE